MIFRDIDDFILDRLDIAMTWVIEWTGLKRTTIERVLICVWMTLALSLDMLSRKSLLDIFEVLLMAGAIWYMGSDPRRRKVANEWPLARTMRILLLSINMLVLILGCLFWTLHHLRDVLMSMDGWLYALLNCLVALGGDDDRPRRRKKIAAEKLKELFGGRLPVMEAE